MDVNLVIEGTKVDSLAICNYEFIELYYFCLFMGYCTFLTSYLSLKVSSILFCQPIS